MVCSRVFFYPFNYYCVSGGKRGGEEGRDTGPSEGKDDGGNITNTKENKKDTVTTTYLRRIGICFMPFMFYHSDISQSIITETTSLQ